MTRVLGVPLVIDPTSLLLGLLIAGSWYPAVGRLFESQLTVLVVVGSAVLGVFVSVLLHELAHGMVGTLLGRKPVRYELMLLGGRTTFGPARDWAPWKDVLTSLAGPATNIALWLLAGWAQSSPLLPVEVGLSLWAVAWVNLALAVFNVLPGLPLDGGQALASVVHQVTGRRELGLRAAAWGGVLIVAGMAWYWIGRPLLVEQRQPPTFNLFLVVMVGWSIASASWQVLGRSGTSRATARLDLRRLARPVLTVPATQGLSAVRAHLSQGTALVLVVDGAKLLGAIDATSLVEAGLEQAPQGQDPQAGQVCQVVPAAAVTSELVGQAASEALRRARQVSRWLVLVDQGKVLGAVPTGAR